MSVTQNVLFSARKLVPINIISNNSDTNWKSSWLVCADFHVNYQRVHENGICTQFRPCLAARYSPENPG